MKSGDKVRVDDVIGEGDLERYVGRRGQITQMPEPDVRQITADMMIEVTFTEGERATFWPDELEVLDE